MEIQNLKADAHTAQAKITDESGATYGVQAHGNGEVFVAIQTLSRFPNGIAKKTKRVKDQATIDRLTAALQAELKAQGY